MSRYDDAAAKAQKYREYSADNSLWGEGNVLCKMDGGPVAGFTFGLRITPEVEATIGNKIISENDINSACQIMHDLVQVDFRNISTRIKRVKEALGKDVVSLNGKTFQNELEKVAKAVETYCDQIMDFENAIKQRTPIVRKYQRDDQTIRYFETGKYIEYK